MSFSLARASTLLGALAILPLPLAAQQVRIDVHADIGHRAPVVVRHRPVRRVVAPRVIVVERVHVRGRRPHSARWWQKRGYRPVQVYYTDGRYYDRVVDSRAPVRVVVVYQRGGQFYRDWDDRYDRYDGYDRYNGYDSYQRDGRYDRGDRYDRYDRDDRYDRR